MFRQAAFIMCHQCIDMSPSVISPLQLFSVFCVTNHGCALATWTHIEPHRTNLVGLRNKNPAETQTERKTMRADEREKGLLPNLSAADVASRAKLSFSGILGRCGKSGDPQQAEKCGR